MSALDSLLGGQLWGSCLTRFIYADEAGWEATSPRTVVAGIIVNADQDIFQVERALEEIKRGIPARVHELCPSLSVKALWGDKKLREEWSFASRFRTICNILTLPRRANLPISFAVQIRGTNRENGQAEFDLGMALSQMAASADKWIRENCHPSEVAMLIYEDMGDNRELLHRSLDVWRDNPLNFSEEHLRKTKKEETQGYMEQAGELRVERIRKRIHFLRKEDDPLLLLADGAAFALRRYFNDEKFGEEFAKSLLGKAPDRDDWSAGGFSTHSCARLPGRTA